MEIIVEHLGAVQFEIKARQHTFISDQPIDNGGDDVSWWRIHRSIPWGQRRCRRRDSTELIEHKDPHVAFGLFMHFEAWTLAEASHKCIPRTAREEDL